MNRTQTVRSKLKVKAIFHLVLLFALFVGVIIIFALHIREVTASAVLLAVSLLTIMVVGARELKQITVTGRQLTYYSLFMPLRRTIDLDRCTGLLFTDEKISGSRTRVVVYIVDGGGMTRMKMAPDYFRNFDELTDAISLKKMDDIGISDIRRLWLNIFGRIKVE